MARAEQGIGLGDDARELLDVRRRDSEIGLVVGGETESHGSFTGGDRDSAEVLAGQERRVDQGAERRGRELDLVPLVPRAFQPQERTPVRSF